MGFQDLGELQRIEVLKGPQGTLFGRNTSAGVINVITKEPEFQFGSEGELTFSNFGGVGGGASVTGPIVDDLLAARLYVGRRTRDGFYDVRTGEGPRTLTEDQDQDFVTLRGQLLLTPSSEASVRVIGDFSKRDDLLLGGADPSRRRRRRALMDLLATDTGFANPARPFDRVAYSNRNTEQNIEDGGVSVEANVDLPWLGSTLTSISAVRRWENVQGQDIDFSTVDVLYRPADGTFGSEFNTLSQEIRLAGSTDRIDWLVGGFYVSERLDRNDTYIYGADYEAFASNIIAGNVLGPGARPTNRGGLACPGAATVGQNTTFISEVTGRRRSGPTSPNCALARDSYTSAPLGGCLHQQHLPVTDGARSGSGPSLHMESKELISSYNTPTGAAARARPPPTRRRADAAYGARPRRRSGAAAFANPAGRAPGPHRDRRPAA